MQARLRECESRRQTLQRELAEARQEVKLKGSADTELATLYREQLEFQRAEADRLRGQLAAVASTVGRVDAAAAAVAASVTAHSSGEAGAGQEGSPSPARSRSSPQRSRAAAVSVRCEHSAGTQTRRSQVHEDTQTELEGHQLDSQLRARAAEMAGIRRNRAAEVATRDAAALVAAHHEQVQELKQQLQVAAATELQLRRQVEELRAAQSTLADAAAAMASAPGADGSDTWPEQHQLAVEIQRLNRKHAAAVRGIEAAFASKQQVLLDKVERLTQQLAQQEEQLVSTVNAVCGQKVSLDPNDPSAALKALQANLRTQFNALRAERARMKVLYDSDQRVEELTEQVKSLKMCIEQLEMEMRSMETMYSTKIRQLHVELAEANSKLADSIKQSSENVAVPLPTAVPVAVPYASVVETDRHSRHRSHDRHGKHSRRKSHKSRSRSRSPRRGEPEHGAREEKSKSSGSHQAKQARLEFYSAVAKLKAGKIRDLERRIASAEKSLRPARYND